MKYKDCRTLGELFAELDRRVQKAWKGAKFATPQQRHIIRMRYDNYRSDSAYAAYVKRRDEL